MKIVWTGKLFRDAKDIVLSVPRDKETYVYLLWNPDTNDLAVGFGGRNDKPPRKFNKVDKFVSINSDEKKLLALRNMDIILGTAKREGVLNDEFYLDEYEGDSKGV
ncbi:hypothetical protein [Thermosipho sp. 1244]|uniref:hypothetical protein n=1 Tax=Thermosipho sp. 1244 TaxID=1755816 RepID=UPI001BDE5E71|nr:hypothetical protein [Thermosipho sp. 1244]MBT1248699.1 hypothetical protein [Thermosipho sp. 1244]